MRTKWTMAAHALWIFCATASAASPEAAARAARAALPCASLGDFYWEIGDAQQRITGGQIGQGYPAEAVIGIASASKLVWAAYVLQDPAQPTPETASALRMLSGYTGFNPLRCVLHRSSVKACYEAGGNNVQNAADVGAFYYNGGHDQKLAMDFGLGELDNDGLARAVAARIGPELVLNYSQPSPAGGLHAAPATYAAFLRKVLRGDLRLRDWLGRDSVCTFPAECPTAHYSPALAGWRYSYNHWVEPDGSFSSPGLEGFYPWISADRRYYGLVARQKLERSAAMNSAACGAAIRSAFLQ
jgi:hypothetical protein